MMGSAGKNLLLGVVIIAALACAAEASVGASESVLWSFGSSNQDGQEPDAGVMMDQNGNLYGTTYNGGVNSSGIGNGAVFELMPHPCTGGDWTEPRRGASGMVPGREGPGGGHPAAS